jgi:hypothetical protein
MVKGLYQEYISIMQTQTKDLSIFGSLQISPHFVGRVLANFSNNLVKSQISLD